MGDILCSLNLTADKKKSYNTVKRKLEGHFRNPIFECAKFNQRWQERVKALMKLQLDPELTLDKATTAARHTEAIKKQQDVVRSDYKSPTVDAINSQKRGETHKKMTREPLKHKHPSSQVPQTQSRNHKQACSRCGKIPSHKKQNCPAREAICHKCSKKGHYHHYAGLRN